MSKYSPGVVDNSEILARYIFLPIQIDKKGKILPSAFSHAHSRGCSIQRDSVADYRELFTFVNDFLNQKSNRSWKGVLLGHCRDIRNIMADQSDHRTVCVYDTAEPNNPAHGELCHSQYVVDEADQVELRDSLFFAFGNGNLISPLQYRNGEIWNGLEQSLQDRK
jgi:hypothetical protein